MMKLHLGYTVATAVQQVMRITRLGERVHGSPVQKQEEEHYYI